MRKIKGKRRTAILSCYVPTDDEYTDIMSPPYPEFPEIEDQLTFYIFPTISASYQPGIESYENQLNDSTEMMLFRTSPHLKRYKNSLGQKIFKYCLSHFGIKLTGPFEDAAVSNWPNVVRAFVKLSVDVFLNQKKSRKGFDQDKWMSEFEKVLGVDNVFVGLHEGEHRLSFLIDRPATKEFKDTAAAIFNLLQQQAETDEHDGFWVTFGELNNKLEDCVFDKLPLEEVRATLHALQNLSPQSQQRIIEKVYPETRNDLEAQIFRELYALTDGKLVFAWLVAMQAEYWDSDNPLSALKAEQRILNAGISASYWSVETWADWLSDSSDLRTVWKFLMEIEENPDKFAEALTPSAWIVGLPNGFMIWCDDTNRQKVFLESMRQQLGQLILYPELIRCLNCPFNAQVNARGSSCCGFGHLLKNIWAAIPNEERSRLKPPPQVCLQDAFISPH